MMYFFPVFVAIILNCFSFASTLLFGFRHSPFIFFFVSISILSKSDSRDTNERESDRYYVGTISRVCTHKQKAGLQSCCSANRGSGIAFRSKQQHRSPRRMYQCAHYARTLITYQWASCAAMFWNDEFTRFRLAKTKRVRRLFQYVLYLPPPERHIPSA